jgi:hypothetical protein
MKISALIAKLERIKNENGDIELYAIATDQNGHRDFVPYNPDLKYTQVWPMRKPNWLVQI